MTESMIGFVVGLAVLIAIAAILGRGIDASTQRTGADGYVCVSGSIRTT
jgi:hypothetical protein